MLIISLTMHDTKMSQQKWILHQQLHSINDQLVARAFILQNQCGPQAFKRDQADIGNRLLFILALTAQGYYLQFLQPNWNYNQIMALCWSVLK